MRLHSNFPTIQSQILILALLRFLLLHALRVLCKTLQILQHSMWRVLRQAIQGALNLVGEPKWLSLKMGWETLQHSMWRVLWKPIQGALNLVGEPKWLSLKMGWETLQVRKPMWKALKLCGY